ncbi:MAG: damage-inducible protein DinB [Paucimonas sp.]|nr:damage-inducible protein DinB [Paucimonas sp.]
MLRVLNHMRVIDRVWQAHLRGEAHGFTSRSPDQVPPFPELQGGQSGLDQWYIGYAGNLAPGALDEVIDFEFIGGGASKMSREDILLHVSNHKTYHRGYVAQLLYEAGAKPPTMDLPVFLREAG